MLLVISISRSYGLVMVVPSFSQQITKYLILRFFLWRYRKDCMYQTLVASIKNLKNRPEAAVAPVNVDLLQCTWMQPKYV